MKEDDKNNESIANLKVLYVVVPLFYIILWAAGYTAQYIITVCQGQISLRTGPTFTM